MTSPHLVIKDEDKGFQGIISEIEKMSKSNVRIGFFNTQLTQNQTQTNSTTGKVRKKKSGLSIAQIAIDNEYGTINAVARPFMRPTYDENRANIGRILGKEFDKIVDGKSNVFKSLSAVGLYYQDLVKKKIRQIRIPVNKPSTILAKGSSKPLIDFGQMLKAVTYEVNILR